MNKAILAVSALALGAGVLFATAPSALAYRGDPNIQGPMQGRGRVTQVINEQNFKRFAEMHQLREEGKIDEANQIREEFGLGLRNGVGYGQRMGMGENWNK